MPSPSKIPSNLTEQGEYAVTWGLFVAFEHEAGPVGASALTVGPLMQKEPRLFGLATLHTVNLLLSRDVGECVSDNAVQLRLAVSCAAHPLFSPGSSCTVRSRILGTAAGTTRQFHMIGPVVTGAYDLGDHFGSLQYEIGYQFGLRHQIPRPAWCAGNWRMRSRFSRPGLTPADVTCH